jgi:serine phosphatase RsbU (regulator of sigma subunit)
MGMPGEVARTRAGFPLSARLVVATSIVVAAAVAASAFFGQRTIEDLGRGDAASRRDAGERAIIRESELVAQKVAAAIAVPLGTSTFGDVPPLLAAAQREDQARGDHRILWAIVRDVAGQDIATLGAPPPVAALTEALARPPQAGTGVARHPLAPATWLYRAPIVFGGATIGELLMGITTAAVDAELAAAIRAVESRARASMRAVWLVAGVVLAVGIVLAAIQGIGMARPLRLLAHQAERIAAGHFEERVPAHRRDEIGALAASFNRMAGDLGQLLVDRAQRAVLERELDLARAVQQSMLPPAELVQHGPIRLVGHCRPASSCGGDWWTYRPLAEDRLLLVVGDATGHGLHSAMIAATARGAVEALAEVDEALLTPEQVLKSIDSAIRNVGDHNVLMTCFAAVVDPHAGVLHVANAGQNFPYVVRVGPASTLEQAEILALSGNPLGDRTIPSAIRTGQTTLRPGDVFVLFSDGVVERQSPSGKLFGDRRLRSTLRGAPVEAAGASLVALGDKVLAAIETFAAGTAADDDLTLVLCQVEPSTTSEARRRTA